MSAEPSEAAWATIAAQVHPLDGRPDSTIKPRDESMSTTGHGVLDRLLGSEAQGGSAARLEFGAVLGERGMGVVRLAELEALLADRERAVTEEAVREELFGQAGSTSWPSAAAIRS